jgi:hypothetical protein
MAAAGSPAHAKTVANNNPAPITARRIDPMKITLPVFVSPRIPYVFWMQRLDVAPF